MKPKPLQWIIETSKDYQQVSLDGDFDIYGRDTHFWR